VLRFLPPLFPPTRVTEPLDKSCEMVEDSARARARARERERKRERESVRAKEKERLLPSDSISRRDYQTGADTSSLPSASSFSSSSSSLVP